MKVKLSNKVSSCLVGGKSHLPGEVFEVTPEQYTSHIMTIVGAPVVVTETSAVTQTLPESPEPSVDSVDTEEKEADKPTLTAVETEELLVEEKPEKKTRKKKVEETVAEEAAPELTSTEASDAS
jgi:uncharacterized protein (DUF39 family)